MKSELILSFPSSLLAYFLSPYTNPSPSQRSIWKELWSPVNHKKGEGLLLAIMQTLQMRVTVGVHEMLFSDRLQNADKKLSVIAFFQNLFKILSVNTHF